jgi:superfamily II DNA or RNA helicase
MTYAVGSLVKARGREWVVLPESEEELLVLRPLGGTEEEITGVYLPLEAVESATFDLPDPTRPGDYRSSRLLRDAVRLGFRSSAGPFRSFAKIAVEPRPYQLVPLVLALRLDPVRILISDDVGIGKTVEAALIARELLDRGEADRLAVLSPPQLTAQWQAELSEKFHIDAVQVLPSTVRRLERSRPRRVDQSVFDVYPHVVVSTDFVKSDRRRHDFFRSCPELVIVDEAHTCAEPGEGRSARHQRHHLVSGLASDAARHMILVTATPHSGKEGAFRSLLSLLDPSFADLPEDLSGPQNEPQRRRLARHFVQRRRADIRRYMQSETPFPDREEAEVSYTLSPRYRKLFDRVIRYAGELIEEGEGGRFRQRVRWWSALALLRSLASSPAAAAATLRNRAAPAGADTVEEADEIGRRTVLDLMEDEPQEGTDIAPGGDFLDAETDSEAGRREHRRLLEMAREAEALAGKEDVKLKKALRLVSSLVEDGYRPILFCRFIPTAEYVADALRKGLKDVEVAAVTGTLPPADREDRIEELAAHKRRVLVATDCLSEGINLQEHFDAVFHYDLSWNPTRHEQREGRVDRYGQPKSVVRAVTYYGTDNQIDGVVLDVLLRKHRAIRKDLGVSVPVPGDTEEVVEAIFEGLLLREQSGASTQDLLPGFEEYLRPRKEDLFGRWESVKEREKRSRTMFAQRREEEMADEVARELAAVRDAIGSGADVARFAREAFEANDAAVSQNGNMKIDLSDVPRAVREAVGRPAGGTIRAKFTLPVGDGEIYLSRTHPIIEGLASHVMDTALDGSFDDAVARRCGVTVTSRVERRTTLLLVRYRFHIVAHRDEKPHPLLAEDCQLAAFTGPPRDPEWLQAEDAEALLLADPEGNVPPDRAAHFLRGIIAEGDTLKEALGSIARERGEGLLEAHRRVRRVARAKGVRYEVEPQLPPDVLGVYVYLPKR